MTLRRIGTDADRITTEPEFLAAGDGRRAQTISRLKRVLAAQALHDPEVAYCQGMSDLLAPFLEIFPSASDPAPLRPTGGEEHEPTPQAVVRSGGDLEADTMVFACFSQLMRHMRGNFLAGMRKVKEDMGAVRDVLSEEDPSLLR